MITTDDILAKLSKETLGQVRLARDISKDFLPTPSLGLNILLGGGIGVGKQTTLWGNEQAGKSLMAMQTIAINQKNGVVCAYFDAERTLDYEWAARLGVDTDSLLVSRVSSTGSVADLALEFIHMGVGLIVIDSTSQLMPGSFYEGDEIKSFENTKQIAQQARELGQLARMIQGENFTCSIINISQARVDLSSLAQRKPPKPSGGKEIGHLDSLRVKLFTSQSESKAIKGQIAHGDMLFEETVGREVTWSIDKNKINGRYDVGTYEIYTRGPHVGVNKVGEILDYGVKYGLVEKAGTSWYTMLGEQFQGKDKARQHLRDNPEFADKLEAEIIAKSL